LALCQTEQLVKIVGVLVVIEIIGYIFGIGFLNNAMADLKLLGE
jgi:hypothetical protein